jgi:hypothetical protein
MLDFATGIPLRLLPFFIKGKKEGSTALSHSFRNR